MTWLILLMTISKKMFQAYYPDRYKTEIEPLFTSEAYLYTGAVIEIVQGYNDDHVTWIDAHSQCKSLAVNTFLTL